MYESIRIDSNRVEPYYSLGIIYVDKGNMAKACEYFDLARIKYYQNNDLVKFESWEDRIDRAIEKYCNYN